MHHLSGGLVSGVQTGRSSKTCALDLGRASRRFKGVLEKAFCTMLHGRVAANLVRRLGEPSAALLPAM